MALKPCGECGREFSTHAKFCPNCGAPSGSEKVKQVGTALQGCGCILTLLITIPFLFVLFMLL